MGSRPIKWVCNLLVKNMMKKIWKLNKWMPIFVIQFPLQGIFFFFDILIRIRQFFFLNAIHSHFSWLHVKNFLFCGTVFCLLTFYHLAAPIEPIPYLPLTFQCLHMIKSLGIYLFLMQNLCFFAFLK